MISSSLRNRVRAKASTLAFDCSVGGFTGVCAGVMSMLADVAEVVARAESSSGRLGAGRPRAAAAVAAPEAVRVPDARRNESIAGILFFCGESRGVEMETCLRVVLGDACELCCCG